MEKDDKGMRVIGVCMCMCVFVKGNQMKELILD